VGGTSLSLSSLLRQSGSTADRCARGSRGLGGKLVEYCGEGAMPAGGGALAFGAATARGEALQERTD
jgi:hypothetical protein